MEVKTETAKNGAVMEGREAVRGCVKTWTVAVRTWALLQRMQGEK